MPSQKTNAIGDYIDTVTATTVTSGTNVSTTFNLLGHIPGVCSFSTTSMAFGSYSGSNLDATATLTVNCTSGGAYSLAMGAGSNSNGSTRRMTNGSGSYLNYGLYSDSGRTTAWGDGAAYGSMVSGTGSGANQTITVTASYSDTVIVTLNY